jgi:hypothetical protein
MAVPIAAQPGDVELTETMGDIRAMAALGHYYAAKIRGAVELARYEQTNGSGGARAGAERAPGVGGPLAGIRALVESRRTSANVFTRLGRRWST